MDRSIETSGNTLLGSRGSGRGIVPTEPNYIAPSRGNVGQAPALRTVSDRPSLLASRGNNVYTFDPNGAPPTPAVIPSTLGGGLTPSAGSQTGPNNSGPIYGDSPFGTLADLYLRMFGPSQGYSGGQPAQVAAVPVGESGGNNSLLIVGLLATAGIGIYWYYYR